MPPKKPRKTLLKSSAIPLEENLFQDNTIQSPIRISSRANKSTSSRFNSDEYLVYYPTKRSSPLKTPDSTQKKRKRGENLAANRNSHASPLSKSSHREAVGENRDRTDHNKYLASHGTTSRQRGSSINLSYPLRLKKSDGGESGERQPSESSTFGLDKILPIAISGDGRFTCTDLVSRGIISVDRSSSFTTNFGDGNGVDPYPNHERNLVLLKNHRKNFGDELFSQGSPGGLPEELLEGRSIFSTQTELELGTVPLIVNKSRKESDRSFQDIKHPLYVLCRNWVRTKLNRASSNQDTTAKESFNAMSSMDKEDKEDIYTNLPPPVPSPYAYTTRIPTPLGKDERNLILEQFTIPESKQDLKEENGDSRNYSNEASPSQPIPELNATADPSEVERATENFASISLAQHLSVWKTVRCRWMKAAAREDMRYADSFAVLTQLYERNAGSVSG